MVNKKALVGGGGEGEHDGLTGSNSPSAQVVLMVKVEKYLKLQMILGAPLLYQEGPPLLFL